AAVSRCRPQPDRHPGDQSEGGVTVKALRWAIVLVVLALAGCGSSPPAPRVNLFGEYLKNTHVAHERMGYNGGSSDDRLANFAAYYTDDQLKCRLLCAFKCDTADES